MIKKAQTKMMKKRKMKREEDDDEEEISQEIKEIPAEKIKIAKEINKRQNL